MGANDFFFDIEARINRSIEVKRRLVQVAKDEILRTGIAISECLRSGGKVLLCGNGGSAADSQHIAAELVIRYRGGVNRKSFPAIALTVDSSIITAGGNDIGFENVFARQVEAYGTQGDVLIGISTSGNSRNVLNAILEAKKRKVITIGLLGGEGGIIAQHCDFKVIIPSHETALIQESHIMIGHIWCEIIEEYLFPEFFKR